MRIRLGLVAVLATTAFMGVPGVGARPAGPGLGRFLTGPNAGTPVEIALGYLRDHKQELGLTGSDINDVPVTDDYTSEDLGVTHVYLRQRFDGIEVYNGNINVNVAKDGSVVSLGSDFVPNLASAVNSHSPNRSASQSVAAAARHAGLALGHDPEVRGEKGGPARETTFDPSGIALEPITAKLVYQPVSARSVRLAWQIELYEESGEHWWNMRVDAESGDVLAADDYISDADEYNVFARPKESPNDGARTLEANPASGKSSPFGWHDTNGVLGPEFTITRGNNVHAYTDIDANNLPDAGSDPNGGSGLAFDFPLDLTQEPSTYRPFAVTNLFYWNNVVHDVSYGYGFDEAAGNFQVNNYGHGGVGGDDVRAEAQDGSGLNNANFGTPPDGQRPRMQMFVWRGPLSFTVNSPAAIAGSKTATSAGFGPPFPTTGLTGDVVRALDASTTDGPSTTDACTPLTNAGDVAGKIALVDRGTCNFSLKVFNAQVAGAVAVIVVNNQPGAPVTMGAGVNAALVTIPSTMVSLDDGNAIKANLAAPVNVTVRSSSVSRDSDLDAGVITHEYTHGISNRLTGGPATVTCLQNAEQMGEGWSDWLALALTAQARETGATPRGIGTYLIFQGKTDQGIRPAQYTTNMAINAYTYARLATDTGPGGTLTIPHGVGFVWASMLWDMYWNLVDAHGLNPDVYGAWNTGGNNLAIQLVFDGMKLQKCSPGFVDGRDAILLADTLRTGGQNQCPIWKAFARRGLGVSASQGLSTSTTDGTAAFDVPASCLAQVAGTPGTLTAAQVRGTQTTQPLTIRNDAAPFGTALTWNVEEAPSDCASPADVPWLSVSPAEGTTNAGTTSEASVRFDSTGLAIGTFTARLCIRSNDPSDPLVDVPVTLSTLYSFSGFFGALANRDERNAGQTLQVVFSLDGNEGLGILAAGYPVSQQVNCSTGDAAGAATTTQTPGSSRLRYDAETNRYTYPWQTNRSWANSCRKLTVRLTDGTDHSAVVRFTR